MPAWYLLEKHRFTSFTDLKAGMEHLEEEVERRAPGTAGFIKKKLGDFIQCFDTLTDIFFINLCMHVRLWLSSRNSN